MSSWSIYIDPATQAPVVTDGRLVTTTAALALLHHAIATDTGSVEGLDSFGAGLFEVHHARPTLLNDLSRRVDRAMAAVKDPPWSSYTRRVYLDAAGVPVVEVTITTGDGTATATFPL